MTGTRAVIQRIVEAFEPIDSHRFRLFGIERAEEADDESGEADGGLPGGLAAGACALLRDALYSEAHCGLPVSRRAHDRAGSSFVDAREYVAMLSRANTGSGSWQPGWRVTGVEGGAIAAVRLDVEFQVAAGEWRGESASVRAGDFVSVRIPKEYRRLLPGFYVVTGDAEDDMDGAPVVRVYWHVSARGAVELVRTLTTSLNSLGVPFHLKTNADPRNFGRTDSLVLYLRRERYAGAAAIVANATREVRAHLDPRVSLFTKRLAPAVGVAEDPGGDESFGEQRSRLVAEALGSPRSVAAHSMAERAQCVCDHVAAHGIDPDALHLSSGSTDVYPSFVA